jgi:hypothetical protein
MSFFSKLNIFKKLQLIETRLNAIEHDLGFNVRNEHGMLYTVHACLIDHATEIAADTQFLQNKFGEDCLDTVTTWNSEKKKQREKLQGDVK